MYQVNLLNDNYYPIRQILATENEVEATTLRDSSNIQGKLAGVIEYE